MEQMSEFTEAASRNEPEESLWRVVTRLASVVAVCFALFHVYTGGFRPLVAYEQRGIHLTFTLVLSFLLTPYRKGRKMSWLDIGLAVLSAAAGAYLFLEADQITDRMGIPSMLDLLVGGVILVLVLEATRRVIGAAITIIAVFLHFLG
jgi:TRAP-type uncharacterized transport system fused permease subunit